MNITRTSDYALIAKLNQYVHDIHATLYPEYFKEYDYEAMKSFFKGIVGNKDFTFLLLEEEEPLGYAWIEVRNYPESAFRKPYRSVYVHQISISGEPKK
ncbi:hypothetical protein [Mesobacillus zeae]|uniref:hypothetical protein n=1 Tax=Mesobacillus zeae TaxID=1917180 RepID=UPI001FEA97B1|nr:hypothetical protein [Mesobacillus zeae]